MSHIATLCVVYVLGVVAQLQDAKLGHLEIVSDFRVNPHGTPILASMFAHIEHHAKSYFVGYTNGDILFPADLIATLRSIRQHQDEGHLTKRILAVGHRFNVDMPAVMHDNHEYVSSAAVVSGQIVAHVSGCAQRSHQE